MKKLMVVMCIGGVGMGASGPASAAQIDIDECNSSGVGDCYPIEDLSVGCAKLGGGMSTNPDGSSTCTLYTNDVND